LKTKIKTNISYEFNLFQFPNTIIDCRAILNDTLRAPVDDNGDPSVINFLLYKYSIWPF